MRERWQQIPAPVRKTLIWGAKLVVTVGVFYLLLNHRLTTADGTRLSIWQAVTAQAETLSFVQMAPFLLVAILLKSIGIFSSMVRWHLLLRAQGICFNFWHIVGSFLIGRFLGTFLPSTVGLDGYKLYDAARYSGRMIEPVAATVIEKFLGLAGILLTFLLTLPLGYQVLGAAAGRVAAVTVPAALLIIVGLFWLLFRPGSLATKVPRLAVVATACRGKSGLLAVVLGLSFVVHFTTAAMYFFTALAVGAQGPSFFQVTFASTIQVFATVMSPLTVAGEGVREVVQAMLLAKHLGTSQSVISAALGFWSAEALTLVGVFFWWARRAGYRPKSVVVNGVAVES